MKTKHPVHMQVFAEFACTGDILLSFIFSYGLRLNTESYILRSAFGVMFIVVGNGHGDAISYPGRD